MSTAEQREERWMETYRVQSAALERLTARVRELEAAARAVLPLLYDDVTDGMIRSAATLRGLWRVDAGVRPDRRVHDL